MTDPAAFWVAGIAVGSLVGAGLGFVVGVAIGNLKRRRPASRFDEGRVQRGNGTGGPTTPKPPIVPKGQIGRGQPEQRPYSGGTLGLHHWHNARVRQALEDDTNQPPSNP